MVSFPLGYLKSSHIMNPNNKQNIKLTFLGDIMCLPDMLKQAKSKSGYDFTEMFSELKHFLSSSDYCFANLETPISEDNKNLTDSSTSFNSPREFVIALHKAGVDFVSTANNHCLDRGLIGLRQTISVLDDIGVGHTGTFGDKKEPCVLDIHGIKLGILSYTYGTNAFANHIYLPFRDRRKVNLFQNQELSFWMDRLLISQPRNIISRVYRFFLRHFYTINQNRDVFERKEFNFFKSIALKNDLRRIKRYYPDFIVLLSHMGGQYNEEVTKDTQILSSQLLSKGVNFVVGSHEHVVHGVDFSKRVENRYATYCLGNCLTSYGVTQSPFNVEAEYSIAWHIYIDINRKQITKTTYSILCNTLYFSRTHKHETLKVVPVYKLYHDSEDSATKQKYIDAIGRISLRFSGKQETTVEKEYLI